MAFVWNAYNILLLIASVLFGIGILFLGFKIAAPKMTDKYDYPKYQQISTKGEASSSSSSLSSSDSATSKEAVRIGSRKK